MMENERNDERTNEGTKERRNDERRRPPTLHADSEHFECGFDLDFLTSPLTSTSAAVEAAAASMRWVTMFDDVRCTH